MTSSLALAPVLLMALLAAPAVATERAIWSWEQASYDLVHDAAAGAAAIEFLQSKRIRTVYLYADVFNGLNILEAEPELYRRFIARLHRHGLRAYALLGSAYLHTEEYVLPGRRDVALATLRRVLDYNAAAVRIERFDGVNVDFEPYILEQWPEQKPQLLRQFLDLGQALMDLKRASGQTLVVGPAIPFWFDGIELEWRGVAKPVSEHVLDIYDYAALMDYRDHAEGRDGIISNAMDEMNYAQRLNKKLVIGVEVTPNKIQKVSFDHLTERDLERELSLTVRAFRGRRAFAGFAIHHLQGYQAWLSRPAARPAPAP